MFKFTIREGFYGSVFVGLISNWFIYSWDTGSVQLCIVSVGRKVNQCLSMEGRRSVVRRRLLPTLVVKY